MKERMIIIKYVLRGVEGYYVYIAVLLYVHKYIPCRYPTIFYPNSFC